MMNTITYQNDVFTIMLEVWIIEYNKKGGIPSKKSKDTKENRAGVWQSHMRKHYKNSVLSEERIHALEATNGWTWKEEDSFGTRLIRGIIQYATRRYMVGFESSRLREQERRIRKARANNYMEGLDNSKD